MSLNSQDNLSLNKPTKEALDHSLSMSDSKLGIHKKEPLDNTNLAVKATITGSSRTTEDANNSFPSEQNQNYPQQGYPQQGYPQQGYSQQMMQPTVVINNTNTNTTMAEAKSSVKKVRPKELHRPINHMLHFVLTLITGGLWGIVWIWLAVRR